MISNKTLQSIRAKILGANDPYSEFERALRSVEFENYFRLAWYCSTDSKLLPIAFGPIAPKELRELHDWSKVYERGLEQSMWWMAATIRCFKPIIKKFVALEQRFADLTLQGRHKEAGEILDEIEDSLGTSLWLLESRIANLETQGGVKDQKEFSQRIKEDESIPSAVRTITHYISYRAEATVTADRYFEAVLKAFPLTDNDYSSSSNLIFRLAFFSRQSFSSLGAILVFEGQASLVDRYLTLIRVVQLIFSDPRQSSCISLAIKVTQALSKILDDPRLESLLRCEGLLDIEPSERDAAFLSCLDKYTAGEYREIISININSYSPISRIAAAEIRAKSAIRANEDPKPRANAAAVLDASRIEQVLRQALSKGSDCLESHAILLKMLLLHPQSSWAADLFGCLSREFCQFSEDRVGQYSFFGQLNGSPVSPRLYAASPNIPRWIVGKSDGQGGLTYNLLHAVEIGDLEAVALFNGKVPYTRLAKYEALTLLRRGNPEAAAPLLVNLLSSPVPLDREDAIDGLIRCLLAIGQPLYIFDQLVLELAKNPGFLTRIDASGLWAFAEEQFKNGQSLANSISVPVLAEVVSGQIPTVTDGQRAALLEDYLLRTGKGRPSRLDVPKEQIGRGLLVYLLRHLAIPAVLDSHIEYESSQDVENERVATCQLLTSMDPDRTLVYSEEIARITRSQLIQRGVRQVEKSKIYVDIAGLRSGIRAGAKDLFERYQSLPMSGTADIADLVLRLGNELSKSGVKLLVSLPRNERASAFNDLFLTIRDRFVSSSEHGLDVYLSVGIRHGTLAGQLRSVFERESLLGRRSGDGSFLPPVKWTSLFSEVADAHARSVLSNAIEHFTDGVDSLVRELRDKYIQISTESKISEGWFNYVFTTNELLKFEETSRGLDSFDAFCDLIIDFLWQRTEVNLAKVRANLTGGIRNSFEALLDKLSEASSSLPHSTGRMHFQAAVTRVRPMMQTELASISAWFTRHGTGDADAYRLDTAIDIARTMFDRCNPGKKLRVDSKTSSETRLLNGRTLPGLVDIFYLLLDNVGKYGKSSDGGEIVCELRFAISDESLEISLENDVDGEISRDKSPQVQTILKEIHSDSGHERAKREGGTGLLKLAKIVRVDFGSELDVSAAYTRSGSFKVRFSASGGRPFR